ncbi:MAG: hypothetical protein V1867_00195 [Candidatus Falkowbacteria bacterium]
MPKNSKNLNKNYQYFNGEEPGDFRQMNLFGEEKINEAGQKTEADIQKMLIKIWQKVLGREDIGLDDNFLRSAAILS